MCGIRGNVTKLGCEKFSGAINTDDGDTYGGFGELCTCNKPLCNGAGCESLLVPIQSYLSNLYSYIWGLYSTEVAYLLASHPAAPRSIHSIPEIVSWAKLLILLRLINSAG